MEKKISVRIKALFSAICLILVLFSNLNDAFGQDVSQVPANQPGYHVKIISPTEGDTFYAGDTIPIKIEAEGVTPIFVFVVAYKNFLEFEKKPFEGEILIPKDFIGKFGIGVTAIADKVNPVASDEVEILIKKREKLVSISTSFETISLSDRAPWQLYVEGEFEDGIVIDISSTDTGTTYESSVPSFITVTKEGELGLQSQSPGIAKITISNSGIVKTIIAEATFIGNKEYEYFSDGTISTERSYRGTYFEDPTLHGIQKFYYKDGTLKSEVSRKDGHFEGLYKEYHPNGNLKSEVVYKNDKLTGVRKNYYENGALMAESEYKNGKRTSLVRCDESGNIIQTIKETYYKNGKTKTTAEYKNGKRITLVEYEWHDNGSMKSVTEYRNGKKISKVKFDKEGKSLGYE